MSTGDEQRARDQHLEMRMRIAKKLEDLLHEEAAAAEFTVIDELSILGMVLGFGMASAPTDGARRAGADAHRRGVEQAMQLREAVESMKGGSM